MPDTLQEAQQNVMSPPPPLFFWFKVKMEATYLSETFYLEINNTKKGVFDSFREIWIIHLYPTSLKPMRT